MDAPIVTCAKCGQRNRLSAASSKKGIWKCRKCGNELSAEAATAASKRGRTLMIAIGAAAAAALLIAVYASFWSIEVSRTRAFATAAAHEFNEGSFDRAAALALSGLPKAGSLFGLFQPGDAEAELRRTGIHQIKDERLIPKGKDADFRALKERFLVRVADGAQVILTDVASGQERPRSIAAVCAKARSSENCAVNEIDTDEEGQRLLLTLDDGSIWLVNADDSAKMVVASKCAKVAGGRSESGSCMPSRIHLSAAGRYAVVNNKPQAFIAYDLDTGAERTLDLSRDCDSEKTQVAKSLCQEYQVRVLLFRGDDVLLARNGSRATLWMLSENGIVRDLPTPVDRAVKGPDKTLTGYAISGDTVAQIIPTAGQTPAQGTTIKLGNCDALIPPSQAPTQTSGCRISSIAVSPKNSDLAVAITGGNILVRQPTGDAPSDPRILRFDCLPIRADAFALFDMDRPTRCSITDLRFAPNGMALAALGNDRMLRVFRIGGEQARSGESPMLASVTLDAAVSYFGFDTNSETLTVVLGTGAIRRFDLAGPPPRGLGALRSEICARLADHASPLTELSAADINEIGTRFPALKLTAADRSPCTP
jgi:predicted regulator of Ras-like GTPase activity (Roadblock/LC7/MglB family)